MHHILFCAEFAVLNVMGEICDICRIAAIVRIAASADMLTIGVPSLQESFARMCIGYT